MFCSCGGFVVEVEDDEDVFLPPTEEPCWLMLFSFGDFEVFVSSGDIVIFSSFERKSFGFEIRNFSLMGWKKGCNIFVLVF
jgi:hypothetical protein